MRLEIRLLGVFEVKLDGELVTGFESNKVRALLAYLAAAAGRPQRRDHLAGLLWLDWPQKSALNNLRYALSDLRKNIADREAQPPFLTISRESIQFNHESDCWVDVEAFERAISKAISLSEAVDLYRGDFLEGFSLADSPVFEDWIRAKGEYYRRQVLKALDDLTLRKIQAGSYDEALHSARCSIEIESWHEPAHQQVMRILALQGKRVDAVAHYERLRKTLQDELHIEPSAETNQLLEQVRSGELPETPQGKPAGTHPNNFPLQLTSFIGREKETAHVLQLLAEHRLVSLTGSGGTGKTRLALKTAVEVQENYPNGAWLVELTPLADPAMVPQMVASTLGLLETSGRSISDSLVNYLESRRLLLILDNCEHLLKACASLVDRILRLCPDVSILATSREVLGVMGEVPFFVPPMSMPGSHQILSPETLSGYDAVHLFVERAKLVAPDFTLTEDNAGLIVEIVHRLDGIPLAIELAAARLRLLGIEQIAQRLNDTFHLLTGGNRTALPRHQTLRASIDWSYKLLSEPERILLRHLSVFAGSWRLQAAEQVCADEPGSGPSIDQYDILDLLSKLVDKSLVIPVQESQSRKHYRMLETIRQYAHEKLVEEKEAETLRTRHLAYYLELAETLEPKLRGKEQVQTLDRLEGELDNLRLALEWGLQTDVEAELKLAASLMWFWHIRFHWSESIDWLEKGLTLEQATRLAPTAGQEFSQTPRALIRAKALLALGLHRFMQDEQDEDSKARLALEESLALYHQNGKQDSSYLGHVLNWLAILQDEKSTYLDYANKALDIFQKINDHYGIAESFYVLGLRQSDPAQRTNYTLEQLAHAEMINDDDMAATALQFLGHYAFLEGDYEKACTLFLKSHDHYLIVGNLNSTARQLWFFARSSTCGGNFQQAAQRFDEALEIYREIGDESGYIDCQLAKCYLLLAQGAYDQALKLIEELQVFCQKTNNKYLLVNKIWLHAKITRMQGNLDQAFLLAQDLLNIGCEIGEWNIKTDALVELGEISLLKNDLPKADAFFRESLTILYENRNIFSITSYFISFAKLAVRLGDMHRAARLSGASEQWCRGFAKFHSQVECIQHEADLAALRTALGEEVFEQIFQEGKNMSIEQALSCALEDHDLPLSQDIIPPAL